MKKYITLLLLTLFTLFSFNVNAQIDYNLRFEACVEGDSLIVDVIAENLGAQFAFGSSDFVFGIYQNGSPFPGTGDNVLDYANARITKEGPWDDNTAGIGDYDDLKFAVTNDTFLILNVIDDASDFLSPGVGPGTGFFLGSGVTDTIAKIAFPIRTGFCGDTIDIRWHPAYTAGGFGSGTINQFGGGSIKSDANTIDLAILPLCDCNRLLSTFDLLPNDSTICETDSIRFSLNPIPTEIVTYFVNGVQVQQGLDSIYTHTFNVAGTDSVWAVIGDPLCLACANYSDTTIVTVNSSGNVPLFAIPFGCDSVTIQVEDLGTKYEWYYNGNLSATTFPPNSFYNFPLAANDSFSVEIVGLSLIGICPDSIIVDTVITNVAGGNINIELGNDTTICSGDVLSLNSGFISNPGTIDIIWNPGGSSLSTFNPVIGGKYFVSVDSAGCVGEDSIIVSIGQSNAQITSIDTFFCSGSSLTLNSAGSIGDTINWYAATGDVYLGSTATISINAADDYYLVAIDTINGITCSDTAFIAITQQTCSINASFTPKYDTVCINALIDTIAYNVSDGDTAWLWNFGSGAIPQTSTDSIPTNITYSSGGTKVISLIVYGPNGSDTTFLPNAVFVKGQLGTAVIGQGGQTSTTIDFNWGAVVGATSYSYKIENKTQMTSTGVTPAVGLPPFTVTATSVNSLDSVCITVYYSNDCALDSAKYCTQAGASNCFVTAGIANPGRWCIGDPICFTVDSVVLPNTNNIVNPNNWSVIWNDDVLSDGDSNYCIIDPSLLLPGNHCIPYTIYSTDPGSDCYAQSFICYTILDSVSGNLATTGYPLPPNEAEFIWNSVPGAWVYEVEFSIYDDLGTLKKFQPWTSPDADGIGPNNPANPSDTSHYLNILDLLSLDDSIVFNVRAISDTACADTLFADEVLTIIENYDCNIAYLKPSDIDNACALDTYTLCLSVKNPADWEVNWEGTGYVPYADCYDFYAANPSTNYEVIFQIRQISDPTCFKLDTIRINTGVREDPYWLVKTDYCISDFPFQIDINRVIQTGIFSEVGHNSHSNSAIQFVNGKWFFYPAIAGAGTHKILHTVCGDTLSRIFTVSGIPCVTTVVSDLGGRPDGIFTTCNGDVYYSDSYKHSLWKINKSTGIRQLLLGNASLAYGGIVGPTVSGNATTGIDSDIDRDGHRSIARIAYPKGIVVAETTGMIYFNDAKNHKIKMYDPVTQVVTTVVGPVNRAFGDDPPLVSPLVIPGANAKLNQPWGMTIDCDDNNLYITDAVNKRLRKIEIPDGGVNGNLYNVTNEAGGGFAPIAAPVPSIGTNLAQISDLRSHLTLIGEEIYLLDPGNMNMYVHNINTGIIDNYMPTNFGFGGYADGLEGPGRILGPSNVDGLGTAIRPGTDYVYFSDNADYAIRTIGDDDTINTVAGKAPFDAPIGTTQQGDVGGPPFTARFGSPTAMHYSVDNFLYVCDRSSAGVGSIKRIAFGNEALGPFGNMDSLYCLNEPQDTLISLYEIGTYSITQGDPSVLTQFGVSDTFFFNPIVADTFMIRFDGKSGCCDIVDSFEVVVLPPPPVLLDSIIFSCDPSTTLITPDSINSNWTYSWLDSNNVEISTNDTLFGVGEGLYYLTITDTLNPKLCSATDSILVQVGFSDTLRITGTNTMCFGDSVILSIDTTAFQNWWWNTGDSTHEINATASGDYIAFASVGACVTSDTFNVIQNSLPNVCVTSAQDTSLGRWIVGTLAGDIATQTAGSVDANAYNARFNSPWDIVWAKGALYVTDWGNNTIRRINLADTSVTTIAGDIAGPSVFTDSVLNANAKFNNPSGIVYNKLTDEFYVAQAGFDNIVRITTDSVFLIAGNGNEVLKDGFFDTVSFHNPYDMDIDIFGQVYLADFDNHSIRKINPYTNEVSTVVGVDLGAPINGDFTTGRLNWPFGVDIAPEGHLVVPEESHNIRKVDIFNENLTTLSGSATVTSGLAIPGYVDGLPNASRYAKPWNVYVCPQGNSYITDGLNSAVRIVDKYGNSTTIAGSPPPTSIASFADGDQDIARFDGPTGITAWNGIMYVADRNNHLIRTLTKNRTINLCEGLTDTLDASCSVDAVNYTWTNSQTGDTISNIATLVVDTTGTYVITITDANGCSNSDSVIVNLTPSPIVDINLMTPGRLDTILGCDGDTISLDGYLPVLSTYNWTSTSPFIGLTTDSIITTDTSGRYILEIFNIAGCSSFDTVDVIITQMPVIVVPDTNLCFGDTFNVDLSTYGLDSVIWNGILDTMSITIDSTNQYIYEGYLNGCVITDTINVFVSDSILLNIGNDTLGCQGDTITLSASPFGFTTYNWSSTSPFTGLATDSIIRVDTSGSYFVEVTDSIGCIAFDTIVVTISPIPSISFLDSNFCFGETYIVDFTALGFDSVIWNGTLDTMLVTIDSTNSYPYEAFLNGCSAIDTIDVFVSDSILLDIGNDTIGCSGDTIVLSALPFGYTTYNWTSTSPFTGLATDSVISVDTSGMYIIEVTDSIGCNKFDTVIVTIQELPAVAFSDSNLCFGETYTVDFSALGFDSVIWNGVLDTMQVTIDSTDAYTYEAFLNGCSTFDTIDVYVADSISIDIDIRDTVFGCLGDSVTLSALPFGYGSYLWAPGGETDSVITVGASGSYSVTVSDSIALNCRASDQVYVEFLNAPVLNLNGDTIDLCFGEDTVFSPNLGNLPTFADSIIWSNGDIIFNVDDSTTLSTTGWYYATSYLGLTGCENYDSVYINVLNQIIIDLPILGLICDDSVVLGGSPTAGGGSGTGFIYNWTPTNGSLDDPTISNPTLTNTIASIDTVFLTVQDSANTSCLIDTFTSVPLAPPNPGIDLGLSDTALCNLDTLCYDFSGINNTATYFWQYGVRFDVQPNNCFDNSTPTTSSAAYPPLEITLTVIDTIKVPGLLNGQVCIYNDLDIINVVWADPIVIDAGLDTAICPFDTVMLGGSPTATGGSFNIFPGDFVYNWSPTPSINPDSANPNAILGITETFYLTVTDTIANCIERDSVNITVYPQITVEAGNDTTICAGDSTELLGLVTPFDPSLVITWTPNTLDSINILTPLASPIDTTVYYLSVTDSIGCSSQQDSVTINVNAFPLADFIADTVCQGNFNTLSTSTVASTITWYDSITNILLGNGSTLINTFPDSGVYYVTMIANNGLCADTVTYDVYVDSIPVVFAGFDTALCISGSVPLSDAIGGGTPTWSSSLGFVSNILNPIYNPTGIGSDSLILSVLDGNNCSNSDSLVITVDTIAIAFAGNYTSGCSNTGTLLDSAFATGANILWTTNGDGIFDNDSIVNATYNFGSEDSVTLTLTAFGGACPDSSSSTTIVVLPSAEAVITANVTGGGVVEDTLVEIFVDEGVEFDYNASTGTTFGWDTDGDSIVDNTDPIIFKIYGNDGTEYLYLLANNEFGCYDWDTIRIDIIGNQVLFVPNVFDVTYEGNTDINHLKVFGTNVLNNDNFEFRLYNRWGELIFINESFSFMNTIGWDGVHQQTGELQSLGVYTYTVKGEFRDGTPFEKVGNVTLVR